MTLTWLFVLALTACVDGAATAPTDDQARWNHVGEILQNVVLGPLHPDLRPAAFTQRNRTELIHIQANHFRAHLLQAMLQALDERVEVCPWPPHVTHDAVLNVIAELKHREFNITWEAKPHWRCPGVGGYVAVQVPQPKIH